jgi:hypothetical protein
VTVAVLDVRGTRPAITPTSADVGRIDHIGDLSTLPQIRFMREPPPIDFVENNESRSPSQP